MTVTRVNFDNNCVGNGVARAPSRMLMLMMFLPVDGDNFNGWSNKNSGDYNTDGGNTEQCQCRVFAGVLSSQSTVINLQLPQNQSSSTLMFVIC